MNHLYEKKEKKKRLRKRPPVTREKAVRQELSFSGEGALCGPVTAI